MCGNVWSICVYVTFAIVVRVMNNDIARARREEVMQILFFSLFVFVIDSSSSYGYLGLDRSGCYLREIKPLLVPTVGVISNSTNRGK